MSKINAKIRGQVEKMEMLAEADKKANQLYERYKGKADLLLNFQMVKAYWKDTSASILYACEKIILEKYNKEWQQKLIRKYFAKLRSERNVSTISIPQFSFEKTTNDILGGYVKKNFGNMIADMKSGYSYPLIFRDIVG